MSTAFGPEEITILSEVLEAVFNELPKSEQTEAMREIIAGRLIAAAKLGERDPVRLREAARK
jgi:hypothetical protein